jgi:hypothetical protein
MYTVVLWIRKWFVFKISQVSWEIKLLHKHTQRAIDQIPGSSVNKIIMHTTLVLYQNVCYLVMHSKHQNQYSLNITRKTYLAVLFMPQLFVSIFIQSYANNNLHVLTLYRFCLLPYSLPLLRLLHQLCVLLKCCLLVFKLPGITLKIINLYI